MKVVRAIVHNQLMRLPPVQRLARRRHRTGSQSDPARAQAVFAQLLRGLPGGVEGLKVLELGPGKGWALAEISRTNGARYAGFDVYPYLTDAEAQFFDLGYVIGDGDRLPFPDGAFDVVWSHSVLEHVRKPASLLVEVMRVLTPGGRFVSFIDLQSHLHARDSAGEMYDFLRYPAWLWNAMTDQRSTWVNRLRLSDWRAVIQRVGFDIALEDVQLVHNELAEFRKYRYLDGASDEDLRAAGVLIVATPTPAA